MDGIASEDMNDLIQIEGYSKQPMLGIILYDFYIKKMVPEVEKRKVYEIFHRLDTNKDGL